jgi:hypothetical protein
VQLSARTIRRAILAGDLEASRLTPRRGGWRVYESALTDRMMRRSNRTRPPRDPVVLPAALEARPANADAVLARVKAQLARQGELASGCGACSSLRPTHG